MADVDVPDEYEAFPFEAKRFVLAEANTVVEIRRAINNIVGLPNDEIESDHANSFTKEELAAILMALGGPQDGDRA
jgi:hypothetical protein